MYKKISKDSTYFSYLYKKIPLLYNNNGLEIFSYDIFSKFFSALLSNRFSANKIFKLF